MRRKYDGFHYNSPHYFGLCCAGWLLLPLWLLLGGLFDDVDDLVHLLFVIVVVFQHTVLY